MRAALSGIVLLVVTGAAYADDGVSAKLPIAQKVYALSNFEGDVDFLTELEMHGFATTVARQGGKPGDSTTADIEKIVAPDFKELTDKKRQIYIQALAANLTVDDMNQLIAFYGTPIGKKIAAVRSDILRSIHTETGPLVKATYRTAWIHHKDDFEKLGLTFAEKTP